jgi:hypothetical protein
LAVKRLVNFPCHHHLWFGLVWLFYGTSAQKKAISARSTVKLCLLYIAGFSTNIIQAVVKVWFKQKPWRCCRYRVICNAVKIPESKIV